MTDERWQKIKALFNEASDRPADLRQAYLEHACAGDIELLKEVETLLAADESEGDFLAQPLLPRLQIREAQTAGLRPGQMIGHYQIERGLGAGGMGVVYLARDTQLGRPVALKLLHAGLTQDMARVRRFQQEARAASALNHPNIITIYDVGQTDAELGGAHFIAAEFVDGWTLREQFQRGAMTLSAALDVLTQVATALAAAHEAGIIHRDIKPENIMLRPDGIVKVLDFGLAKLTENSLRPASIGATNVTTQPGIVMGTVSYMSPEQARGLTVDGRSDLFSLGVVIYELLTGHAPFEGETTADVLAAVLGGEPRPLTRYAADLPIALQEITSRALAKPVEQRYQTALEISDSLKRLKEELSFSAKLKGSSVSRDEILALPVGRNSGGNTGHGTFSTHASSKPSSPASNPSQSTISHRGKWAVLTILLLAIIAFIAWRWTPSRPGAIDSIAVLPFANLDNDAQMEYLPDGLTETLIDSLSRLPGLTVRARAIVFKYKGREIDPIQIGQELKVRAVLTGHVRREGDRLVIRAELVNAADGTRLWGDQYHPQLANLPTIRDEIARSISQALLPRLSSAEQQQLARQQTANSDAYQLYLRGRHFYYQDTRPSQEKALDYYKQAVAIDPNYALAHAGIAYTYATFSSQYLVPSEAIPKAKQAALIALQLDERLPEAHLAMAQIKLWGDWDWPGAEQEFKRAIELNSGFILAHAAYANFLANQKRFDEAEREARKVEELDPVSALPAYSSDSLFYFSGQYDRAIARFQQLAELNPNNHVAHFFRGLAFSQKGLHEEAISEMRLTYAQNPQPTYRAWLAYVIARGGQRAEALKTAQDLERLSATERISPVYIARIYIGLGDKEKAFAWLQKAYDERNDHLLRLGVDPIYIPLRDDPRYAELMRGIGLKP